MRRETKRIEAICDAEGKLFGCIKLDAIAIPETVCVTVLDETMIPSSFTSLGRPLFTTEQTRLFGFKEDELKRELGDDFTLEAVVTYEESGFEIPRSEFDSIAGIKDSLRNLADLTELIENRYIFCRMYGGKTKLKEFVIFGSFVLDKLGRVISIEKPEGRDIVSMDSVENFSDFKKNNGRGMVLTLYHGEGYVIPKPNEYCPCCGRRFTIEDIVNNPCVASKGKTYHEICLKNYEKLVEIDRFVRIMKLVYGSDSKCFDVLPNGYWKEGRYSHIPWLNFHTPDGDIIIGCRKRVISIEWQSNFKPFSMKKLFDDEDVTTWEKGKKRGIHAWNEDKMLEYLKKVKDFACED